MGSAPHPAAQPVPLDLQQPLDALRCGVRLADRAPVPAEDLSRVLWSISVAGGFWLVTRTTSESRRTLRYGTRSRIV
jgi:hypothetical protein